MSNIIIFDSQTNSKIKVEAESQGGNQYIALCPFHDDHTPSLGINTELKKYHCLGCGRKGVVCEDEADDPEPDEESYLLRRPIETYDYCSANGTLLYQVCRYTEPPPKNKSFTQRRPDGNGGWIYDMKGVIPVLYHLQDLLRPGCDHIFICEGEKDADSLRALGLIATTNPMGAGKWRSFYNPCLIGRDVILLPDNDDSGRKHTQQVAASLKSFTKSTKIAELPDLPEKGDVSDFLRQTTGVTKESFLELIGELAKPWVDQGAKTLTLIRGCEIHYQPREPIVRGFPLYKKLVYLLSGDQGDFKSILTLHMSRCITSANYDLFGKYKVVEKGPVILFDEETPQSIMEERLQGFGLKDDDLPFYLCHFSGLQIDDDQWLEEVLRKVDEVRPVAVGFDSFIDFHAKDENSPIQMQQVMKRIRKIANAGPMVWLLAHNSKEAKLTRGTTAIPAAVDMEFFTKVNNKDEVTLEVRKNRIEPFEPIVVIPKFEPMNFRVDFKQTKDQDVWDKIEEILSSEPIPVSGIVEGLRKVKVNVEEKAVRSILSNQVSAGFVKTDKIKINITLADGRIQRREVEHFWK